MPETIDDVRTTIEKHWGFRELRSMQEKAIQAALERRDSLVVMPTGGGKSLCYQAPAAHRERETTVVISPLIALMKDQVDHLTAAGVSALRVDSTLSDPERRRAADELRAGRVRLLFVSPERIVNPNFQSFLREIGVRTFAIDEAHCISHWGHDFRPEYRQISTLRDRFPEASFHAFTATATPQVREDIAAQLHLKNPAVLVGNFDRPNLTYRVWPRNKALEQVLFVLERHRNEAGIIYCPSRNKVDELTMQLRELGYNAMSYRAAQPGEPQEKNAAERVATHDAFRNGQCDLVIATVAFGMGIDRPDIRFVLHTGMPKSIEHYQQEAGRAGRDGLEAECILLHSIADLIMWKKMLQQNKEDGRIDAANFSNSMAQLEEANSYAQSVRCRHRSLVSHFGQDIEGTNCGACDVCLGEVTMVPDSTVIAKKILSCVARVEQRFGAGHVAEVLRGANTERIAKWNHSQLSTYGLLKEFPDKTIREWINQLVFDQVLVQTNDEYPTLKLNAESWEVMKGNRPVMLGKAGGPTQAKKSKGEYVSWEGVSPEVFDALRQWRRETAVERGVAPFIIFNDSTLREIARTRPGSLDRLRAISGVGENKLRDFGSEVVRVVKQLCKQHSLELDVVSTAPSRAVTTPGGNRMHAYPHFRDKMSIAEVAMQLNRAESTVREYLCGWIEDETPESVDTWVDPETYRRIAEMAEVHGNSKLRPIFTALDEQVPYDAIRITLCHLAARRPPI
jgi:ATP-dependent DNA helicase RecQ